MKNLKLFFSLFILALSLSPAMSQRINVHSNEFLSSVTDLHRISEDEFIMASKTLSLDYWTYGRIDWIKNGEIVKELELPYYCRDIQLHEINGKIIIDVDYFGECDVLGGFFHSFSPDTLQEDNMYPRWIPGQPSGNDFYKLKRYQDSLYATVRIKDNNTDPDTLEFYNSKWEKVKSKVLPGKEFKSLVVSKNQLITYNHNELIILTESEPDLDYITISSDEEIINVKLDSSVLYILTEQKIKVINYDGEIIDSITIDITDFSPSDLEYFHGSNIDNGFYMIGTSSSENDGFYHYKEGQWLDLSAELSNDVKVHDLINFDNEALWVTGNVQTYNKNGELILQNLTYQEIGATKNDDLISLELLEVTDIGGDSVIIAYTINNLQDKTVKDINLNSLNFYGGGFCPGVNYSKELALDALESRMIRDTLELYNAPYFVNNFCLFTSGPDRILDGDLSNNTSCRADIVNTTSQEIHDVSVYPNPSSNTLNVRGHYNESTYEIFSVNGQKVLKGKLYNQINIEGIDSGIYFLNIITDNKIIVTKFVKSK